MQTPADGFFSDGTNPDNQRQKTVLGKGPTNPHPDFMIMVNDWLHVQEGFDTTGRDKIDVDSSGKPYCGSSGICVTSPIMCTCAM